MATMKLPWNFPQSNTCTMLGWWSCAHSRASSTNISLNSGMVAAALASTRLIATVLRKPPSGL